MRLSWQEIKIRARAFSERWKDAHYEKGETQSFYNEFFHIFGVDRKKVGIYEKRVELIDQNRRGFIDLLWPGLLLIEQKSAGRDLIAAEQQAFDYVLGLKDRDQDPAAREARAQCLRSRLGTREHSRFPCLHSGNRVVKSANLGKAGAVFGVKTDWLRHIQTRTFQKPGAAASRY